ncbi:uncharacterized protein HMPREF1541_01590 [Cyphellophora europaea CBS 101466]|uniref:Chromo domain-containing protein n=1 Tax=Cyphellophora europaea (strain CBS 101466) TaxID=1220924 RepID=W2S1I4_CYPE1|nr:uncharacterized protein HMPREF1541_01590 [Cyphellophora europaea CBS 101466]ETN42435.1 hypothetical protein HMPREF1541_01590 [Cyphellophora europaea CBS 101466]
MTRTPKRALLGIDYRARSPKRRKFSTAATVDIDSPPATQANIQSPNSQHTKAEKLRLIEEEGVYPARAILQEKRVGTQKQYLVDWEAHPETGEVWEPSWEPKKNVTEPLLRDWRSRNPKKSKDLPYEPSQALPSNVTASSSTNGLGKTLLKTRLKRSRPIVTDSSSDIASTHEADAAQTSITPSLASTTDSSADDDYGPISPSFEISESQHQSSLSNPAATPAPYTVQIPPIGFDKSEYESLKGSSQINPGLSSPLQQSATPNSAPRSTRSQHLSIQNSPILLSSQSLSSHKSTRIPASAERDQAQIKSGPNQSPTFVIQESSSESRPQVIKLRFKKSRDLDSVQPVSPQPPPNSAIVEDDFQPILSSAQPHSLIATSTRDALSQRLQPIQSIGKSSSESSSLWNFESQLPEVRRLLASPTTRSRGQSIPPKNSSPLSKSAPEPASSRQGNSSGLRMDTPAIRQSPRLQSATPVSRARSPRASQQSKRARTPQALDEFNSSTMSANVVTSPLATNPPHIADCSSHSIDPTYLSAQPYQGDSVMGIAPHATVYDPVHGVSALPIQQSIEEEPQSSADSIESKASSSQVSLQNERIVPQVDGVSLPVQPVIGPGEYLIGLPAEGKIQSIYNDLIHAKRKLMLKFIYRRDSVGSANGSTSRTIERNEMIELMERLQDTSTHMDLGLPGFATQYSIQSQEATAYAQYAGSKFVFLGELISMMQYVDCGLVIASKPGPVQDLLADFIKMKHVQVRRHDRPNSARAVTPEALRDTLKVDLITTTSDAEVKLSATPALMIAFDASFDNQSSHVRRIRELYSQGRDQPLPVVHLLVTNSSEHVDRCLRKAMPSPQRLKLLVRGTYLARANLGGSPTYVPHESDGPEGVPMDMHDLQRAVRKSPNRKLKMIAAIVARAALSADFEENWSINTLPEVQYDELEETPPGMSGNTTTAGTAAPTPRDGRMRTRSPVSRSATPSGKKRMLDVDAATSLLHKRQRLTPMRDLTPLAEPSRDSAKIEHLQEQLKAMAIELATEKESRLKAEEARDATLVKLEETEKKLQEWQNDHSGLLRRYEKQRDHNRTIFKENKRVTAANENIKIQADKVREINTKLRGENTQLKADLASARDDLKAEGGDIAALEEARSTARTATEKAAMLEKSLENTKRDFEFTRQQYQQASNRAAELGSQTTDLEAQIEVLTQKASGEQRRLKEINNTERTKRDRDEVKKLTQENRGLVVMAKKLDEENKVLKKNRGVQTRGSSAQPPGSPGIGGGFGRRSRQNSPAVGARDDRLTVPGSSASARDRVSAVRNDP